MRKAVSALWIMFGCCICFPQQTPKLIDGARIMLVGTVGLEQRGNKAYIVIKPGGQYEAVFDSEDHRRVREIGLGLFGQESALRALAGQKVTVNGKVQLEPNSPYYLNGTLIVADSVRTASGSVLRPEDRSAGSLPVGLARFYSLVIFDPRSAARFTYKSWNSQGRLLTGFADFVTCGLNGPGDVMNCYCPKGFVFTGKGDVRDGKFEKTEAPAEGFDFAQYMIGDAVRRSVSVAVECTRQK